MPTSDININSPNVQLNNLQITCDTNYSLINDNRSRINAQLNGLYNDVLYLCNSVNSSLQYRVGAWNMNGWKSLLNPDNQRFKQNLIKTLDLDIYLLSETHCLNNETVEIDGFKVYNYNRQYTSSKNKRGSGGVAIALNKKLLVNHVVVSISRGNHEGILAIKLRNLENDMLLGFLANYLPPDSFTYGQDAELYFQENCHLGRSLRL